MRNRLNSWMKLVLTFGLIWSGLLLLPALKTGIVGKMLESTDTKGIEADALFYAETELSTESAQEIMFTIKHNKLKTKGDKKHLQENH